MIAALEWSIGHPGGLALSNSFLVNNTTIKRMKLPAAENKKGIDLSILSKARPPSLAIIKIAIAPKRQLSPITDPLAL